MASVATRDPVAGHVPRARQRFLRRHFLHGNRQPVPRLQLYILPSRRGWAMIATLVVMLLTSLNYGLSLGFAVTFLLAGLVAASLLHAFRNLAGIEVRPLAASETFAGGRIAFTLSARNPASRRRPALRLGAQGQWSAFELPAAEETAVALACPALRRGRLALGRSVLETRWPLGLIRAWSVFVPKADCLVLPTPEADPPPLPPTGGDATGASRDARTGDEDFAGLRAHRSADSPRHVAWKAVARGGPMLTKEFAAGGGRELLLDWDRLPAGLDAERRLSRLTAWVLAAEREGRRYALALPGIRIAAATGRAHRERCLRLLALHGLPDPTAEDGA